MRGKFSGLLCWICFCMHMCMYSCSWLFNIYIYIYILLLLQLLLFYSFISFSHQHQLMVFHWSLSYNKSPQVSRTLLNILADINTVTLMFHSFFSSQARSRAFFKFHSVVSWDSQVHNSLSSPFFAFFFLLTIIRFDRLAEIKRSVCITEYQWGLSVSFSGVMLLGWYMFVWSNLNF